MIRNLVEGRRNLSADGRRMCPPWGLWGGKAGQSADRLLKMPGGPLGEKFAQLIDASFDDSALEPKTRQLVYVALMTAARHAGSLRAHVGGARAAEASKDEIVAAIMMAGIIGGATAAMDMLPIALEVLGR